MLTRERTDSFESRKREHIELALDPRTQALGFSMLEEIRLTHEALPNFNFSEIKLECNVLGSPWKLPLFVSSMTAGHTDGRALNERIVRGCRRRGWAMGVGSQRRQLQDSSDSEWGFFREVSSEVFLMGNIGITQVIETPTAELLRLINSLNAKALVVHLNGLQECLQPEGTPNFRGSLDALRRITAELPIPVILKETGCGFSLPTLKRLSGLGLSAIDVAGLGGTHWGRVEGMRSLEGSSLRQAADTFADWGVGTVESLKNATSVLDRDYRVWASGGVRSGLDAAKLLALGAEAVGYAKPIMEAAVQSDDALNLVMETLELELRIAMFCTGSPNIEELGMGKVEST